MNQPIKIMLVAGARPNFMKIAPLISAIKKFNNSISSCDNPSKGCHSNIPTFQHSNIPTTNNPTNPINYFLVHTGQHYDLEMSETFFRELEIPKPDINLEVGSSSQAVQTAEIMKRFEPVLIKEQPDGVVVVGDVNSTMACALVASKIQYPAPSSELPRFYRGRRTPNSRLKPWIAHVEAGLRSYDRTMPEEINRLVTDALSDLLFTPSEDADQNLLREGIPAEKIKRVGNIMIDTLVLNLEKARKRRAWEKFNVEQKNYVFVTLHRPSNVDDKDTITAIFKSLSGLCEKIPVVFPMHPRTKKKLEVFGLWTTVGKVKNLKILEPIGYLDTLCLEENSRFVLTDSGGIQEETTFLKIPCLTLRPNTERPITVTQGTNKLTSLEVLDKDLDYALNGYNPTGKIPELWDGKTAERIVQILTKS